MALAKETLSFNFSQGLDTKTDPYQIPFGKFLALENSVFDDFTLKKRNGFKLLSSLPANSGSSYVTTFNGNLTAISNTIYALAEGSESWVSKGYYQPLSLTTLPLIRNSTNQSQVDMAISPNGSICTAYTDNISSGSSTVPSYRFAVADSITGQNIVAPTVITSAFGAINGAPRVFSVGNYFVIIFSANNGSSSHLQFISVNINTNIISASATDISTSYSPSTTGSFDGVVVSGVLYVSWASASSSVQSAFITSTLALSGVTSLYSHAATTITMCADITPSTPTVWTASYNSGNNTGYITATNNGNTLLSTFATPVEWITTTPVVNSFTIIATNQICTLYYELANVYSGGSIVSDFIKTNTVTQAAVLGIASTVIRSVGLASKAFSINGTVYFLTAYQSPYQSTYFLMNSKGQVISKIAYSNGGGYVSTGLPNAYVNGDSVSIPYLIKDLIQAANTGTALPANTQVAGIYSQTGINLVTFTFTSDQLWTSEIANNLHLNGGFLWMYDGYLPVEHNFFLWPDSVTVTGSGSGGSLAADTYYYQATYEWADNQGNVHRSAPSIPVSVTTTGSTSEVTVVVPTLRLTYKTANPLKIVIYRYGVLQPVYYQVTSLTVPTLNDTTTDTVTFVDKSSNATILGNNIIYTNGGVVENIGAPSFIATAIFDTRLFGIDAEDPNLLWFAKQAIEAVPIEMSDLFTLYVSPTISAQGSTGPMATISAMDDKLIIGKKNALYYINGSGPDNTGANSSYSQPTFITATVGCANQNSIVLIPNGLMFQSDKGIWLLGRDLSTKYIGSPVESYNSIAVNSALAIPGTNQVRFTLENGVILVYDYYYDQWGTFNNIPGISSVLYQDLHTFINAQGLVYQENPGSYLDGSSPVLMKFVTGWENLSGVQGYLRAYSLYMLATYKSPHFIATGIAYDYNSSIVQGSYIVPDNYSGTWGSDLNWGSGVVWGGPSTIEQWELNFIRQQCQSFQLTFQEFFDASLGLAVGEGINISAVNLVFGKKKGWPGNIPAVHRTS